MRQLGGRSVPAEDAILTRCQFGASVTMDMIGEESDETILACDVSDEALEAAASPTRDGAQAMSFPNAPTVSILIICCGNG